MTGFNSKRDAAADKLQDGNSFEEYCNTLPALWNTHISRTYAEQFFRAGQAAQPAQEPVAREWNFCPRCGKRTADLTVIHTCTPPQEKNL